MKKTAKLKIKDIRVSAKLITALCFAYLYFPLTVFFLTWFRPIVGIPTAAVLLLLCVRFFVGNDIRNFSKTKTDRKTDDGEYDARINILILALTIAAIVLVLILIGFGGIFPQSGDWYKHNAILKDLVNRDWPVFYYNEGVSLLTYYIGQYIVPALLGKATDSVHVAQYVMGLWGMIGVVLVYLLLNCYMKVKNVKETLINMFMLLFFSGCLPLAQIVIKIIIGDDMYSIGNYHWILSNGISLQYRSNLVMLRWVYPQIIAAWLICLMLEIYKDRIREYCLIMLPLFLFGIYQFLGLAVLVTLSFVAKILKKELTFKGLIKQIFSISNISVVFTGGVMLLLYYWGNVMSEKPYSSTLRFQPYIGIDIFVYIFFCLFMFGFHYLSTYKENKNDPFFVPGLFVLLVLPFAKMGVYNDIVMCTSVPPLFFLCLYSIRTLSSKDKDYSLGMRKGILILLIFVGTLFPIMEIRDNVRDNTPGDNMYDEWETMQDFANRFDDSIPEDVKYNYYTYDIDNSIFTRFLARR
ncbi:MAG: hypothetical protein K5662_08710 [Lachnospiraceae bacterium]|nr:hypothetical protein [Lachnospiraceae bacterium]